MEYVYYYDLIATIILVMLFSFYTLRHYYPTETNLTYLLMAGCCLVSSVTDLISMYTVPHADTVPRILNYAVNMMYLFSYNITGIVYFIFVLFVTKGHGFAWYDRVISLGITILDAILIFTTPFTGFIFYFDENNVYRHGSLFIVLYVTSFFVLIANMTLYFRYRKKLSRFQTVSILMFNTLTIISVLIQMLFPKHLISNLIISLYLVVVYVSLQNPDYFIEPNSKCYNENALHETLHSKFYTKSPFSLLGISLEEYQYTSQLLGVVFWNELMYGLIADLHKRFGLKNVYWLSGGHLALMANDPDEESGIIADVKSLLDEPRTNARSQIQITPHIGVIRHPDFVQSVEETEEALNCLFLSLDQNAAIDTLVATPDLLASKKRETKILLILRNAIQNNGFHVYYQPIYSTKDGHFSSAEALIRLFDDELGFIPPDEFIVLAEQNGMILEIGEIVFRKVCDFLRGQDAAALGIHYIEVNLSAVQCMQDGLSSKLIQIMAEYGVRPEQINFEITETIGVGNRDALDRNMNHLIDLGSSFSMDDYGTGFSTANYLISLPVRIVKIDKSILWPAMENRDAFTILEYTVKMLKALDKQIVVEGVETAAMAQTLISLGCDYLQGYLYSRPVPAENYVAFLREHPV